MATSLDEAHAAKEAVNRIPQAGLAPETQGRQPKTPANLVNTLRQSDATAIWWVRVRFSQPNTESISRLVFARTAKKTGDRATVRVVNSKRGYVGISATAKFVLQLIQQPEVRNVALDRQFAIETVKAILGNKALPEGQLPRRKLIRPAATTGQHL